MPRPREFDETAAVEQAMQTFWSHGYEATSTQQLCEATGLGRSSIYNTFTSKHALLRRALRHYDELTTTSRRALLSGSEPVRARVRRLLDSIVDDELAHDRRGCLAINTLLELGKHDEQIARDLERDLAHFTDDLTDLFAAAQRDGDIDRHKDPVALAQFVHSTVGGLRMTIRLGVDRRTLDDIVSVAVSAL